MRNFFLLFMSVCTICISAQPDSIYIKSLNELRNLTKSNIQNLTIDFILPKNFDYSVLPDGLTTLRFLKESRNLNQPGQLFEKLKYLETLELCGQMVELLPEFLYFGNKIKTVKIRNAKMAAIWNISGFVDEFTIEELHLVNVRINESCMMYKQLFYYHRLNVRIIYIHSNRKHTNKCSMLLGKIFNPNDLYVNGVRQQLVHFF